MHLLHVHAPLHYPDALARIVRERWLLPDERGHCGRSFCLRNSLENAADFSVTCKRRLCDCDEPMSVSRITGSSTRRALSHDIPDSLPSVYIILFQ